MITLGFFCGVYFRWWVHWRPRRRILQKEFEKYNNKTTRYSI